MEARPVSDDINSTGQMKKARNAVEQVNEILEQNARILDMNEVLLKAIVKHNDVSRVEVKMSHDDLLRWKREISPGDGHSDGR